jgi:hypothetical protein
MKPSELDVSANTIVRRLVREAVAQLSRELVVTLRGRQDMNRRTATIHPDAEARRESEVRIDAYENAIGDLARIGADVGRIERDVVERIREGGGEEAEAPAPGECVGRVREDPRDAPLDGDVHG